MFLFFKHKNTWNIYKLDATRDGRRNERVLSDVVDEIDYEEGELEKYVGGMSLSDENPRNADIEGAPKATAEVEFGTSARRGYFFTAKSTPPWGRSNSRKNIKCRDIGENGAVAVLFSCSFKRPYKRNTEISIPDNCCEKINGKLLPESEKILWG